MLTDPQFKRAQRLEDGRSCEKYALREAFNSDVRIVVQIFEVLDIFRSSTI